MNKRSWSFIALTLSISWSLVIIFRLLGWKYAGNIQTTVLFGLLYMFVPFFSVLILESFKYKNIKESCGINFKLNVWFLVSLLLPFFLSFASSSVATFFPNVEISTDFEGFLERVSETLTEEQVTKLRQQLENMPFNPLLFWIFTAMLGALSINALVAFGEEVGWRGYLFNELSKSLNFWQVSLITGFVWGIWHAPLILQGHNYPNYPHLGVLWMTIFCILYSPIFNLIRIKSNSVIAASILHGAINASYGFSVVFLKGGNELTVGMLGLAGFVVLLIVDIIIWLYVRR